jgi:hypothetical protein
MGGKPMVEELAHLLSNGAWLRLYFPHGDEQPWMGGLKGAAMAIYTLADCMLRQERTAPTQPYERAPTQPYETPNGTTTTTQPYD